MTFRYYYYILLNCICTGNLLVSSSHWRHRFKSGPIVAGSPAIKYQFPYMVSIQLHSKHLCNGVIVSPAWVISTARPFYNLTESIHRYKAVAGTLKLGENTRDVVQVGHISRAVLHPHFYFQSNLPIMHNDIAAVEIQNPFVFGGTVTSINLPYKSEEFLGTATVAGWGVPLSSSSTVSPTLHYLKMTLITLRRCSKAVSDLTVRNIILRSTAICAVPERSNEGFCSNDSGSPLLQNNVLVGIVSWRPGDCFISSKRIVPVVFTNINEYLEFIHKYVT